MLMSTNMHIEGEKLLCTVDNHAIHGRPETIVLRIGKDEGYGGVTLFISMDQLDAIADAIDAYTLRRLEKELDAGADTISAIVDSIAAGAGVSA